MAKNRKISILFPPMADIPFRTMTDTAWHDLGMDALCEKLSPKANERGLIAQAMKAMTDDPAVSAFRIGVFEDILAFPELRSRMMDLLSHVQFLNDYGSFRKDHDMRAGLWELLHRFSELDDYISSVEAIRACLEDYDIQSEGFTALREYVISIYEDLSFAELKKDIKALKADTSNLRSITIGINLNKSFEVDSIGLISVNSKEFRNSGILGNLSDAINSREGIREDNKWDGSMRFHPVANSSADFTNTVNRMGAIFAGAKNPLLMPMMLPTLVNTPEQDSSRYITHYFDKEVSSMLSLVTRRLEQVLSRYVNLSIGSIADLIPEFMYYIRWAEFIEKMKEAGFRFCRPETAGITEDALPENCRMNAKSFYNLKLAATSELTAADIVPNDLDFSAEHTLYLLTGANRGGKTTLTQAVGLLYVLAQGGICVPAESFVFSPVDCIYTHYPADEDKTMDLGRLGEECRRFREIYDASTENSLLLLNETFSTTSFEEGYYIAGDAVRAILNRGTRTIYNTHMHKLAVEIDSLNRESNTKAASLIAEVEDGTKRSFRMKIAPPEGRSHAEDIAVRYGVTYEALTGTKPRD
ncbi:MAG: DNA mismatch repair protein [Lachnospiraceae bacterium]|nr:DNA mismatch repair protein [Lachnospiraceae bacterium]